ncbi:MAG: cyclic nucleotide-binding domain-containing protein [Gammaproteobacteria bacterium]|nr:cyclic nucleotide-binding domain-containing protein [Gammaproteobacteria bacterium]
MSVTKDYRIVRNSLIGVELNEDESKALTEIMAVRSLAADEVLINEGEPEDTLFLLAVGDLAVTSEIDGKETVMYTMNVGECAGTRSFIDGTTRKATLKAVAEATIYTLEPDAFEGLLKQHPRVVYKVMRALFRVTHSNLTRMNVESQALSNYINKSGGRY